MIKRLTTAERQAKPTNNNPVTIQKVSAELDSTTPANSKANSMADKAHTPLRDASLFFKTLLKGATPEMGVLVLCKTEKVRQGIYDPTDIQAIAQDSVDNNCAYYKTALMNPSYFAEKAEAGKHHAMGGKKEAQFIFALQLDVDCNKPGYLKREAAITVLREMEKPPTIIVNSKGQAGGLHAYWCLTEPFDVRDPGELARAQIVQTSLRNEVHRLLMESGSPCSDDEGGVKRYLDDAQTVYRALRPAGSSRGLAQVSLELCKDSIRYDLDELMYDEVESRTVATSDMAMPSDAHYGEGDPGTDFMRSDHGVSELMLAMEDENYTFQRVDGHWSWKHPDSESENDCSGTLGIKSKQGNYLLTSFSPNTPFSNTGESITIFQAMADFKFDGDLRATASWLRAEGFGEQQDEVDDAMFAALEASMQNLVTPESGLDPDLDTILNNVKSKTPADLFYTKNFRGYEVGPGLLTLIGAPPGMGKTALQMQHAFEVAKTRPELRVVIANGEMTRETLLRRELTRRAGVSTRDMRHNPESIGPQEWARLESHARELTSNLENIELICNCRKFDVLKKHLLKGPPGFLVLDYIQLFGNTSEQARVAINGVIAGIKELTYEGWAVAAISATKRGKDGDHDQKELSLSSFKESGELEFQADAAYILTRNGDYGTLKCVKNRNDEMTHLEFAVNLALMEFRQIEPENRIKNQVKAGSCGAGSNPFAGMGVSQ